MPSEQDDDVSFDCDELQFVTEQLPGHVVVGHDDVAAAAVLDVEMMNAAVMLIGWENDDGYGGENEAAELYPAVGVEAAAADVGAVGAVVAR